MDASVKRKLIVVIGSTGTGKSDLAISLALQFKNLEVVNADALQLYKGLDIITNKVTAEECQGVPHHLLGILDPETNNYSVCNFRDKALDVLEEIWQRNCIPVLVGGTNYYIESLIWKTTKADNIDKESLRCDSAATCDDLSDKNEELEYCSLSNIELHALLESTNANAARDVHPGDRRRALNRLRRCLTSQSYVCSAQDSASSSVLRYTDVCVLWIQCDKDILDDRLDRRADSMVTKGLMNELCNFCDAYSFLVLSAENRTYRGIFQAIGIKEFLPFICLSDRYSEDARKVFDSCVLKLKLATRQYARKQISWIKNRFLGMQRPSVPVYALDGIDLQHWNNNVVQRAVTIVDAFLKDEVVPFDPLPITSEVNEQSRTELKLCDACGKFTKGLKQYTQHMTSRSHKKRVSSIRSRTVC